jgi:hypothetical protein
MRVTALLLVLFATAGALAACGSSSKAAPSGAQGTPGGGQAFAAYTDCLRKNGVTLPSNAPRGNRPSGRPSGRPSARPSGQPRPSGAPRGGGFGFGLGDQPPAGVDAQTWQAAMQACAALRPSGGPQNRNGALTAYRNCLSDHGVTMSAGPAQLDSNDPKIVAAMKACEALLPTGRPAASPTG